MHARIIEIKGDLPGDLLVVGTSAVRAGRVVMDQDGHFFSLAPNQVAPLIEFLKGMQAAQRRTVHRG